MNNAIKMAIENNNGGNMMTPALSFTFFEDFIRHNCLRLARCENITNGTISDGSRLKGKCNTATFGCSKANCCNGEGDDNKPLMITLKTNSNVTMFQATNRRLFTCALLKARK